MGEVVGAGLVSHVPTIMLPEDLRRRALFRAKQTGVSLGELIRDSLDAALPNVTYDAERDALFEDVEVIVRRRKPGTAA